MSLSQPLSEVSAGRILRIALPALATLAADPVLSLVDTAFVGRMGTIELAALGVDAAIFTFAFALFNFLAYATTPMVARARGAGDLVGSGRVVRRALRLAVLIGVMSTALLAVTGRSLIALMQAAPEVIEPAWQYLSIRTLALPAVLIVTAANGAFRGFEDTRTPLWVTVGMNLVHIVLLVVLVSRLGMGIAGAAVATVVAQWMGAGVLVWLLSRRGEGEGWSKERIRLRELSAFLRVGSVLVVRTLLLVLSLTSATAVAARIGTVEVAAHQILSQVWFLAAMIVDALAIAAQALVAGVAGAGDEGGAARVANRLLRWGLWLGLAIGGVMVMLRGVVGTWFSQDPGVVAAVAEAMWVVGLMQPLAALLFVLDGIFLARLSVGLLARSTLAGFVSIVAVLGAVLVAGWGLVGVWVAISVMVVARLAVLATSHLRTVGPQRA